MLGHVRRWLVERHHDVGVLRPARTPCIVQRLGTSTVRQPMRRSAAAGAASGRGDEPELPRPVERPYPGRTTSVEGGGEPGRRERRECRPRRQQADPRQLRALPAPAPARGEERPQRGRCRRPPAAAVRRHRAALRGVLGPHRVEEDAGAELSGRDVAGHAGGPPGGDDLDVEARLGPVAAVERPLVDPEHVRDGLLEQAIQPLEHVDQELQRARGGRASSRDGRSGTAVVRERAVSAYGKIGASGTQARQPGAVATSRSPGSANSAPRARSSRSGMLGHEVERVDLPVRVRDGRADLGAAVLEHEHVGDVAARAERGAALGPQVDHPRAPSTPSDQKRRVVARRVEDDLAARRRASPASGSGTSARRTARAPRARPGRTGRSSRAGSGAPGASRRRTSSPRCERRGGARSACRMRLLTAPASGAVSARRAYAALDVPRRARRAGARTTRSTWPASVSCASVDRPCR